ncbi:potassium channel family protein [Actimicrobium sp. CCI2.3]|uniref:potassium channel family protein n=1 Tax=Actimicrobium sp. CCI2.3 TaxID=3048616 RepID=UPI002AB3F4C2|nr:potassium channel family protein [Actimicrobium sp. CCI2.3]MDY7574065.1 potassium channel family protein [Actimicrobium sp. CCI2.3]MEB0021827.1 potassium channel family protein [Actimicrobium sp. CCI2.3]
MKKSRLPSPFRPILFVALVLSIPAFYLLLDDVDARLRGMGSLLYAVTAVLVGVDLWYRRGIEPDWRFTLVDAGLLLGALASAWPTGTPWSELEWWLRLTYSAIVFLRFPTLLAPWALPRHLMQIIALSIILLALAGAGFYWLEPRVLTYADGLWLAFITGATVGYGDLVPSTHASRVFAVFIVLLGYAIFSVITASIAALFVGEDVKHFQQELHADIRALRHEIALLHKELNRSLPVPTFTERADHPPSVDRQ